MQRMLSQTTQRYFVILCLLHFTIWVLVPTLIFYNPPTDSLEGIAWGNLWLLGYEKHPFLAPWLSAGFTNLFGVVGWPIYLLSQISIISCFVAIWLLAKRILSPWQAFLSVFLLEGISYYNLQSVIFDPNILMLPLWAFSCWFFYLAVTKNKIYQWILLGFCIGLAMLAKYESALLVLLMLFTLIISNEGRKQFRSYPLYLAAAVSFLVFVPNLYWLVQHNFDAVFYAVREMQDTTKLPPSLLSRLYKPFEFFIEQIFLILPVLILYLPFYRSQKENSEQDDFTQKFLWVMGIGPLVTTVALSLLTGATLVSRWGFPFFSLLPLLMLSLLKPKISKQQIKYFLYLLAGLLFLLISGQYYSERIKPYFTHQAQHSDTFPGRQIANLVTTSWHKEFKEPLPYIVGSHNIVVNIAAFSADKPVAFFNWSTTESPWIDPKQVKEKGAVFVLWPVNIAELSHLNKKLQLTYPKLTSWHIYSIPRPLAAKVPPVVFAAAVLPPEN